MSQIVWNKNDETETAMKDTINSENEKSDNSKKSFIVNTIQYVLISSILIAYFSYQLSRYLSPNNKYSRTDVIAVEYLELPYIKILSPYDNVYFDSIYIHGGGSDNVFINSSQMLVYNQDSTYQYNYTYNGQDNNKWILYNDINNSLLLIPPKNGKMSYKSTIKFLVYTSNDFNLTDYPDKYHLYEATTNGLQYGVFYTGAHPSQFDSRIGSTFYDLIWDYNGENTVSLNYALISTFNYIYLSLYELYDNTVSGGDVSYYTSSTAASIMDTDILYKNAINDTYEYYIELNFALNPTLLKTVITTNYLRNFSDVISNTFSIFGILTSVIGLIAIIFLNGIEFKLGKLYIYYGGYAPDTEFDIVMKRKLDKYLEEKNLIEKIPETNSKKFHIGKN